MKLSDFIPRKNRYLIKVGTSFDSAQLAVFGLEEVMPGFLTGMLSAQQETELRGLAGVHAVELAVTLRLQEHDTPTSSPPSEATQV